MLTKLTVRDQFISNCFFCLISGSWWFFSSNHDRWKYNICIRKCNPLTWTFASKYALSERYQTSKVIWWAIYHLPFKNLEFKQHSHLFKKRFSCFSSSGTSPVLLSALHSPGALSMRWISSQARLPVNYVSWNSLHQEGTSLGKPGLSCTIVSLRSVLWKESFWRYTSVLSGLKPRLAPFTSVVRHCGILSNCGTWQY